mmetsp:Transcript_35786/g.45142  ORF Transcript_35786/g.45142 Transcript_35786/m.45142 type:complete len:89 (-) Transcript_35786:483-749(-)
MDSRTNFYFMSTEAKQPDNFNIHPTTHTPSLNSLFINGTLSAVVEFLDLQDIQRAQDKFWARLPLWHDQLASTNAVQPVHQAEFHFPG